MPVKLALAAGLLAIALAAGATLAHAPVPSAYENAPRTHESLIATSQAAEACQAGEVLPRATSAVRLGLGATLGPQVSVRVIADTHVLARGVHGPGWEGASVTIPLRPATATVSPVTICVRLANLNGTVSMFGSPTGRGEAATSEGKPLPGRMHIEYLGTPQRSWWSMASAIAQRLGLGRAASGTWNAFLVMLLAGTLVALSAWLLTRELR